MKTDPGRPSSYSVPWHDAVDAVQWSPFEWSSDLLAIASTVRVTAATCRFEQGDSEINEIEFTALRDFHHAAQVMAIAWSPASSLLNLPKNISFCTAGADGKIRVFSTDLKTDDEMQVLEGHTSYVNDVTYDPEKGEQIASVSDDNTCIIWDVQDRARRACFSLGGPGMSVKWHSQDPLKIMVAEKGGVIRFYNVLSQRPIMSLDCGKMPLLMCDWCPTNPLKVIAAVAGDWAFFDTSRSSRCQNTDTVHTDGCKLICWSRSNENLVLVLGRSNSQIKVINIKTKQAVLIATQQLAEGGSWHPKLPIVTIGGDKIINFWRLDAF